MCEADKRKSARSLQLYLAQHFGFTAREVKFLDDAPSGVWQVKLPRSVSEREVGTLTPEWDGLEVRYLLPFSPRGIHQLA